MHPPFSGEGRVFGIHVSFAILWHIWLMRNNIIFRGMEKSCEEIRYLARFNVSRCNY